MEFGLSVRAGRTYEEMLELAQHAEELGYDFVFVNDHVHGFSDDGKEPYLDAWTVSAGIGVQTSRIKIGLMVLNNSLRNPAYLAKSIATLDNMVNGRYEIFIGAGWNEPEYVGYDIMGHGRGMPSAKERVDRLEEALEIIRGMLSSEVFSYDGKYWKLKNAINIPQPVQKYMRISVGASKPRMIRLAARLADGLGLMGNTLDRIKYATKILKPTLEKKGKSLDDFYLSGMNHFQIAKNLVEYDKMAMKIAKNKGKTLDEIKEHELIGTTDILIEKLQKAQKLGTKMICISQHSYREMKQEKRKEFLEYFRDEIISRL